jgi:hypothetical protein
MIFIGKFHMRNIGCYNIEERGNFWLDKISHHINKFYSSSDNFIIPFYTLSAATISLSALAQAIIHNTFIFQLE